MNRRALQLDETLTDLDWISEDLGKALDELSESDVNQNLLDYFEELEERLADSVVEIKLLKEQENGLCEE